MPSAVDMPEPVRALLRDAFGQTPVSADLRLLKQGNYANANVYRWDAGGRVWTVKEFYSRSWIVRHTIGRILIRRECQALVGLAGIAGVPGGGRRLGFAALAEEFIEGETLRQRKVANRDKLPRSFFVDMERLVGDMHRAGYAHLDLRNLRNVMCTPNGRPCLLDFQSCVRTVRWPRFLRRVMENTDRSSIYKAWSKLCDVPLDPEQNAGLERFRRLRKWWVVKGYWLERILKSRARRKRGGAKDS